MQMSRLWLGFHQLFHAGNNGAAADLNERESWRRGSRPHLPFPPPSMDRAAACQILNMDRCVKRYEMTGDIPSHRKTIRTVCGDVEEKEGGGGRPVSLSSPHPLFPPHCPHAVLTVYVCVCMCVYVCVCVCIIYSDFELQVMGCKKVKYEKQV